MAYEDTRNYQSQGGSTWVVTGKLEIQSSGILEIESGGDLDVKSGGNIDLESGGYMAVASGGYITVASGGQFAMPVVTSTSNRATIPNYGTCIIRNAAATADDYRFVAAPTRAGLVLNLVANCAATGVNVCVAPTSAVATVTIETSGVSKPTWELAKASTQRATLVSANTSQWFVIGPIAGTLSSDGSS